MLSIHSNNNLSLSFPCLYFFFPENEASYVSVSRTLGRIQQYLKVLINTVRMEPIGWNRGNFSKPWTLEISRPTVEPCMYLWALYAPGLTDVYDKCNNLFCTKKGRISCSAVGTIKDVHIFCTIKGDILISLNQKWFITVPSSRFMLPFTESRWAAIASCTTFLQWLARNFKENAVFNLFE